MLMLPQSAFKSICHILAQMDEDYNQMKPIHRELADYILPMRYSWLEDSPKNGVSQIAMAPPIGRNKRIIDSVGTKAARDLAAGMLNGVASPAREWFNLRLARFQERPPIQLVRWLQEVRRRMFVVLAESNFYNSMALMLLDLVVFGTAGMLVYEDFDDVIRCYNLPVGEFRIAQNHRRDVHRCSRVSMMTIEQLVQDFGEENLTEYSRNKYKQGGKEILHGIRVGHLIEANVQDERYIPGGAAFREFYWELTNNPQNQILSKRVFTERPGGFPRWEVLGNNVYGLSPGMDALGDIIQLQHEQIRKSEAIDLMTDPPMVMDAALKNQRGGNRPGGRFYVPSYSTAGAKPTHQTQLPLADLTADIRDVQQRIRDSFFNDLFRMISQLQTVRSATEIDARREEKLILMGAVLERLENEALDPIMARVFGIMKRKGLIPELPEGFEEQDVQIQYASILSDAQRAAGTSVIERFMQVVGNTAALVPDVKHVVDWHELLREYGGRLSVPATGINPREVTDEKIAAEQQGLEAQQAAMVGNDLTQAAKNLSETELGGGQNAFQALLGGV